MKSSLAASERSIAALSAAGAAVLLRFLVDPVFGNGQPFIFVFPAVYLIGRRLGTGPALLTLVTGLAASRYLFFPPRGQFLVAEPQHQFSLCVYALLGLIIILVVDRLRRAEERLAGEIDERRQAELAWRLQREEFRVLTEKCPAGIFRTDASGACTYVNEYWCRLSGQTAEETMGSGWGKAIHPEDLPIVLRAWHDALASCRTYTVEYRLQLQDGTIRHAITTGQPVANQHGAFDHYIGTVVDITELKRAYASLEQKERILKNLIEAQEHEKQTIGRDIHDGLMQYAIGARMLLESVVQDNPGAPGTDVIGDVLGYLTKGIEDGRQIIRGMRPTVLDDLGLKEAIEDLAIHFAEVGVGVECRIDPDLAAIPPSLQTTIYRIVQESLNNSWKHSGSDRAFVSLQRSDRHLRLEIEDHGRGFDVEPARQHGFGLIGMTERMRLAGGTLRIDSSPGRGSRILGELPLATVGDDAALDSLTSPGAKTGQSSPPSAAAGLRGAVGREAHAGPTHAARID